MDKGQKHDQSVKTEEGQSFSFQGKSDGTCKEPGKWEPLNIHSTRLERAAGAPPAAAMLSGQALRASRFTPKGTPLQLASLPPSFIDNSASRYLRTILQHPAFRTRNHIYCSFERAQKEQAG